MPLFFYLAIIISLFSAFSAPIQAAEWDGAPVSISRIDIRIEEDIPDDFNWPGMVRDLIQLYLKQGQPLTRENLASARQALEPFGQVDSRVDVVDRQAVAAFTFNPYKRVKTINVKGNYPIFEREVRQVLGITSGDIFRPQDMPEQSRRIVQLYQSRGFIDPQVDITWQPDPGEYGHQQLHIAIDAGPYYHLADVKLSGNQVLLDAVIKGKLSIWRKDTLWAGTARFEPLQLRQDIDELTEFYRKQGYYDVDITSKITFNAEMQQATVRLKISEGPLYSVTFSGNTAFWDYTLEKDLPLVEIGNIGNRGLHRGIQAMRRRYLTAGFADSKISWQDSDSTESQSIQRNVVIQIEEGRRHVVESVTLSGNSRLEAERILGQMLTRPQGRLRRGAYVDSILEEDIAAVRALYLQNGFLSVQIDRKVDVDPDTAAVAVHLAITEGVRTLVGEVTITGQTPVSAKKLRQALKMTTGQPYQPFLLREEENALAALISPLGHPHIQVRSEAQMSDDQTRADLRYSVDSGPLVKVGELYFAGNFHTKDEFVARETGLTAGEAFSLPEVLEGQRDVRNLGLFDSVQVNSIGLKEQSATVPLLIAMKEKKPYFFELGGGYQSDKGFYGRSKAGNRNLTGTGKDIWLGTEISEVGYRWEAGFGEPRLLETHFKLDTGIFVERKEPFNQDFGTDTMGSTVAVSRKWERSPFTTSLGLRFERRQQFLTSRDAVAADRIFLEPRSSLVTTPAVSYDDRDSFIRPRRGWLAYLAVDFSKGLDNELDDFIKYRFDARWFLPLSERLVLATRVGVGYLQTYGTTDELPKDQFFYLGGTSTVRGFAENMLRFDEDRNAAGGQLYLLGSVEVRYSLGGNWELAAFVDTGSIGRAEEHTGRDDLRWASGLGLQYNTPIGPIGLFYGRKIDPRPDESPGQWHFSIGYTF